MSSQYEYPGMNRPLWEEAVEMIQRLESEQRSEQMLLGRQHEAQNSIAAALALVLKLLLSLRAATDECRIEVPYAEIRRVIDADGNLQYCCTHDPEHCAS